MDSIELDGEMRLNCPALSDFCHLHQGKVTIYNRSEDDPHPVVTTVQDGVSETYIAANNDGNPSPRRQGMTIEFMTEQRKAPIYLNIYQHKGETYMFWHVPKEEAA